MWWCNFEIYPFYNFFHNCWHGLLWSMQRSFKIWLKAGYDGPKNGTFTKSSVKTPSHSQHQGLKFFKNNQVGPWIQLDPKRRLGPLIILSFSSQNHVFSLSQTLSILSLIRSLLSLTHNGKTIILLSLFESVPWKQLSRNFKLFLASAAAGSSLKAPIGCYGHQLWCSTAMEERVWVWTWIWV